VKIRLAEFFPLDNISMKLREMAGR